MPGDPKECHQHAMICKVLAEAATDALSRQTFLDLAKSWSRLAAELEHAAAFLNALQNLELGDRSERVNSDESNQLNAA